jgi:AcrR family transcriptional regulator
MEKSKNSSVWTEAGYEIFAAEGMDGIQVERLARILALNKSGFYHYFGDVDGYYDELIKLHKHKADLYLADVATIKMIDPDYFNVIVKHKLSVIFHLQLIRRRDKPEFYNIAEKIDQHEDTLIGELWSDYLGFHDPALAMRYFAIVRDMLYARVSLKNLTYPGLRDLMTEAKAVMQQITKKDAHAEVGSP